MMGNSSVKFDIVSNLPRELVLIIISHLSQKDVANCLLVSHAWNAIVCNLAPYWWTAIQRYVGLSREAIARVAPSFTSPRALFIAAKKYKRKVGSNKLKSSPVDFSPSTDLQFTLCLEAKDMTIVRTQKLKNDGGVSNENCKRYRLLLEKVSSLNFQDSGTDLEVDPVGAYSLVDGSSVAWAHVAGDRLYWVTRHGLWRGINIKSRKELFSWKNNLLNNGCGVTFACCVECSMLVATQWMPLAGDNAHQSAYALQVVSLAGREDGEGSPKELISWKMFQTNHDHLLFLHHDSRYWIRETLIISSSKTNPGKRQQNGLCQQHTLIVQSDRCTVLHTIQLQQGGRKLTTDSRTKARSQDLLNNSQLQLQQMKVKIGLGCCINCEYDLKYNDESVEKHYTRNVSSAVNISSDKSLLGMVFKGELHVWKFSPYLDAVTVAGESMCSNNSLELVSRANLMQKSETLNGGASNSIRLVALGHNLSIIAYHYDTYVMDYQLNVVMTHSGESVMEFRRIERFYDWSLCCQVDPLHKFYFMTLDEEWLNKVQSNNIVPLTPLITVHNHHGRMHIEAIQCYRPQQSWRKHWRCFMQ